MRMSKIWALAGALLVIAAACGDDGGGIAGSGEMTPEEFCNADDTLDTLDPTADPEAFQQAFDELENLVDQAPDEIRDAARTIVDAFGELDLGEIEDDPTAALSAFEAIFDEDVIAAGEEISEYCAEFEDGGGSADDGDAAGDVEIGDLDEALDELPDDVQDQIDDAVDDALGDLDIEGLIEDPEAGIEDILEGAIGGGSDSGLDDAVSDCFSDFEAQGPGDNDGCDELYDACEGGDMAACDDLWVNANIGSEYEEFGATCGGRADDESFAGSCSSEF